MDYLRSHPWLTFSVDTRRLPHTTWMQLGEIISKAQHVSNAPIDPEHADSLYKVFLAKGAAATTAIEGNTLTEDQVHQQIDGKLKLPPSQKYLQQEVQNVINACNELVRTTQEKGNSAISVDFINSLNRSVLEDLELEDDVVPGEIRRHSVVVAGYRGAPSQDCHYLLDRMCSIVEELLSVENENRMLNAVFASLFAHVYIALIHPYGDGNGRTSRLLEVYILLRAGFPMPTCQLLSNHYNKTRNAYYRNLDALPKVQGDLTHFITYAVGGFVDGLREQVETIQSEQVRVTWVNYVHDKFSEHATAVGKRRRDLALAISEVVDARTLTEVFATKPDLARIYARLDDKTLTRDINVLASLKLITRSPGRRYAPRLSVIKSFLPWVNNKQQPVV